MPVRRPEWLKRRLPTGRGLHQMKVLLRDSSLHTICEEASCPNIGDCFSRRTACFMILGRKCTRNCRYCDVEQAEPDAVDPNEPKNIAEAVHKLGLNYVVITSVTRDDLADGGAEHFAETVRAVRELNHGCKIELLIPDFNGSDAALKTIIKAKPDVLGHNLETVKEPFLKIRPQGSYETSLALLKKAKELSPQQRTKSGMMLGMGETREMLISALEELRSAGVDFLTLGQYLQPSRQHWPVRKYYTPEEFEQLKKTALEMGFEHVESGPLVRSSYHADELMDKV
jgi:lipoic acid synthetase